jgi:hypothetical protein
MVTPQKRAKVMMRKGLSRVEMTSLRNIRKVASERGAEIEDQD